jgi:uncharacterized protein with PQ loop repeat
MYQDIIGWSGFFFYSICYFPQIYGIYKNESPELNMTFMYLQFLGASSMFTYGVLKTLYPIIVLNAFSWICVVFIIIGMLKNKKENT